MDARRKEGRIEEVLLGREGIALAHRLLISIFTKSKVSVQTIHKNNG